MKLFNHCYFLLFNFVLLTYLAKCTIASKILFLSPVATKSHKNVFDPLIDALATRGHELTVISPMKTSKVPSVKEIVPVNLEGVMGTMKDAFELRQAGPLSFLTSINFTTIEFTCNTMYEMEEVKWIMKHEKFDLIILNGMICQCAYGLVAHFKAPYMLVTTMPASAHLASSQGHRFPPSFVPEPYLPLSQKMTFLERGLNLAVSSFIPVLGRYYYNPRMEAMYRKYVPSAPGVTETDRDASMILMNSHYSLTYPRPLLPNVVEVGGMHCRPGQALPKDLDDFISGAKDGVILFSLGSIVKAKNMPESTRKAFINVFAKLKQRVIWKWEVETMEDLPKNVKLIRWAPQQDILAHKNIRLFITHGGLLSTQEAVYHGVPLIDLNMGQAEKNGFCLTLEIMDLSEQKLEAAVTKILTEPKFKENAQTLSKIYRDQIETPLERAVFWTEYVIRHKGAHHMQSASKDLNFFQYHSIDVISFILLSTLTILWLLKYLLWNVILCKCICRIFKHKRTAKVDHAKKSK
ncbi:UDP-glucuronosyltransferase 2B4 isoform X2 [Folsomia candida]|uniref:UDP-glucuronosyltransferase 2B4 isoform X2 n=1 Tax=Folsomia candida TaxID=158441 RepID=UPI000B8F30B1|nr:UDP-glucuronosyltransferase 2B4 isoform X2 [Folsomia candida]